MDDRGNNSGEVGEFASSSMIQESIDLKLLAAESLIWTEKNVTYFGPLGKFPGKIVITRYRMVFLVGDGGKMYEQWKLDIPLGQVSRIEKVGRKTTSVAKRGDDNYGFTIYCKDYRVYRFTCNPASSDRKNVCDSLNRYAFPLSHNLPMFASVHAAETPRLMKDGWKIYSAEKEYERLGIPNSRLWKEVDINKDYKFSETYPRTFVIPTVSWEEGKPFVKKLGEFRSKERIPVLSWINQTTLASISRCSQPMTGISGKRSAEDERHLTNIMNANANCRELLILDARPAVNAKLNKAKGGGYEENYVNAPLTFLNIHNIHVVRDSLKRLLAALIPRVDEKGYYKALDESKWLNHVQSILEGAVKAVFNVDTEKQSVLIHCSDGWDRTAQLTSLAMIQLDSYYRTIEGFIVLIEKEWCSFGHKFGERIGHGDDNYSDGERSPVFVQFCDCLWQIMRQFPWAFEFTQELLICMLDELYACRYGTFLYNSEKIRLKDKKCDETTISFWSYVLENKKKFRNPMFKHGKSNKVINVNPSLCGLHVWIDYYARSNPYVVTPNHEDVQQPGAQFVDEKKQLLDEIMALDDAAQKLTA
ncbi:Phosphatidylinositol-3,5-bisphosphate 3-phosphatase mtm-1 [Caenorhabditis elegans]|uniref:Phosphatidylinositol-3,5-bisphosphate 3-phosphatase mtm-1 n=1 Tax=Caenorhabditis elegans TaxID=6239 RepID=MTMR1_CAEEL|nr:Myotubularin-related protein 1 [Caenorhabditis elegans]Q9N589.2 RecName: Full=Myotubularin-related protein 1; AltName: Full=Phosphatidylinositol-3,5-bisphosphate 3-phosphatase; AltName: Full=Phosphatidylinositol-3-phosphate phosphatase [Caenorhabditis elegans]CCD66194.1 Myotubularin-related protein 1 [Caenorhabditis elegans]|eukprot:NP_491531.2 Myotubularin-related protein 1 [Caenorhabditis elegans]